jgi:hypothetical protein
MTPAAQMSTSMPWQATFLSATGFLHAMFLHYPRAPNHKLLTHHDSCCPDVHLHAMAAAQVLGR